MEFINNLAKVRNLRKVGIKHKFIQGPRNPNKPLYAEERKKHLLLLKQ
jgi:hypothetical protein